MFFPTAEVRRACRLLNLSGLLCFDASWLKASGSSCLHHLTTLSHTSMHAPSHHNTITSSATTPRDTSLSHPPYQPQHIHAPRTPSLHSRPQPCPPASRLPFNGVRDVTVATPDGECLHGYAWPPSETPGRLGCNLSRVWLVVMHGNAGNRHPRMPWFAMLREQLGCGIICVDYRGYGGSTGEPSQAGLYADGEAVAEWVAKSGVVPTGDKVVLYGESIGSSVVTHMATRAVFDGLILHAPFTSVAEAGQLIYPFLPVKVTDAGEGGRGRVCVPG